MVQSQDDLPRVLTAVDTNISFCYPHNAAKISQTTQLAKNTLPYRSRKIERFIRFPFRPETAFPYPTGNFLLFTVDVTISFQALEDSHDPSLAETVALE